MALRVLLADESSTIKRVIQLALQDYAVDVKSVPVGLDVMSVAKSFKPDVVFADILLPKRTGYEICQDLKSDATTRHIPVILMWSGFMDLDEKKAAQCKAEGRLEKPFETEQLRSLVQSLVPQLKTNPLSSYLKFPKLPEFSEPNRKSPAKVELKTPAVKPPEIPQSREPEYESPAFGQDDDSGPMGFNIDAIPESSADEGFQQIPLHKGGPSEEAPPENYFKIQTPTTDEDDNQWAKQDLGHFKLNLPEAEVEHTPAPVEEFQPKNYESMKISMNQFEVTPEPSRNEHNLNLNPSGSFEEIVYDTPKPTQTSNGPSALDLAMAEKILREEAQKMLENMLWKILPEIAERVVKEEINKLIQDTEKSI